MTEETTQAQTAALKPRYVLVGGSTFRPSYLNERPENWYGLLLAEREDGSLTPVICQHGGSMWLCRPCAERLLAEQDEWDFPRVPAVARWSMPWPDPDRSRVNPMRKAGDVFVADDGNEYEVVEVDEFRCAHCGRRTLSMLCGCEKPSPEKIGRTLIGLPSPATLAKFQEERRKCPPHEWTHVGSGYTLERVCERCGLRERAS